MRTNSCSLIAWDMNYLLTFCLPQSLICLDLLDFSDSNQTTFDSEHCLINTKVLVKLTNVGCFSEYCQHIEFILYVFLVVLVWGKCNPPFFPSILLLRQNPFVTIFHSSQGRLRLCIRSLWLGLLNVFYIAPLLVLLSFLFLVLWLHSFSFSHCYLIGKFTPFDLIILCLPVLRLADTKVNKTFTCYSQGTYSLIRGR